MGSSATSNATRSWRIKHPWLTDNSGRPEYYRGNAPTFHGLIYFVGSSGDARVMLTVHPVPAWAYAAIYATCVIAALCISVFVRAKEGNDVNFGRKLSATIGLLSLVPMSAMSTQHVHPVVQPAAAGIAPIVASVAMVLGTLVTTKLPAWFPDTDPRPKQPDPSAP